MHAQKDADKDQDGIPDSQDNCPYVVNQDQADNDKDGLGNACDTCPYEYGPASNNGCPEKAQPVTEDDSDKDGLPNSQDSCPYDFGPASNYGCPEKVQPTTEIDNDKDGLPDSQDNCPYDYGPASNNGCPEKAQPVTEIDSDKDGVLDSQDNCPYDYGPASNNGCPEKAQPTIEIDSDKDGIGDSSDKCPYDYGPVSNSGCPVTTTNTVPAPVSSFAVPHITQVVTPSTTPAPSNPPGMVINVLTSFEPAGPGSSIVHAQADAPGIPGVISVFVDSQQRTNCIGVRDCMVHVPDLNSGSRIGVLVFNNNNQNGVSGDVPESERVNPGLLLDTDGDGVPNFRDNCPADANPNQGADADHDGVGDACDRCDALRACNGGAGIMQNFVCGNQEISFQTADKYYHQSLYGTISQNGCGCRDTDGNNYFTRGSVVTEHVATMAGVSFEGPERRAGCQVTSSCEPAGTDFCIDSRTLNEMTCGPTGVTNATIRCPQGCRDGACECPDTDGGWNYYVAGDVDGRLDTCTGDFNLTEYACTYQNGMQETGSRIFRCPYGCDGNGACQCTDSDGGSRYDVPGYIGTAASGLADYCMADGRTLVEMTTRLRGNECFLTNTTYWCEGRCMNGACHPPTCNDGIQNQGETNIDCGRPCTACGLVKLNGTLLYEESEYGPGGSNLKPVRGVTVGLVHHGLAINTDNDEFPEGTRTTTTDSRGHFEFIIPRAWDPNGYGIKFKPRNVAAEVEKDYDGWNEYVYFLTSTAVNIPDTGIAEFGDVIVPISFPAYPPRGTNYAAGYWYEGGINGASGSVENGAAYFNIAEDIAVAANWALGHRGDDEGITQAKVQYPDSVPVSRYNWKGEECIAGDAGFRDVTIIHEYGHQLAHDIGTLDYSTKIVFDPSHEFCTVWDEEWALNEGFPEWFGHLIVNRYRTDPAHWMSLADTQFDRIESPDCGYSVGMTYEGGVMATLWDLIDMPGGEYYNASAAETWDTVGGAAYEDAVFKIWDIETDNAVDAPDLCQFIWGTSGWKNWFRGRPEATQIDPMLAANNVTDNC